VKGKGKEEEKKMGGREGEGERKIA